jgi:hypothetical protein
VLFIDLDGFKAVNDTYGHTVGDQVLVEIANRLSQIVRSVDTVARLGGDEFVAFCESLPEHEVREVVDRIQAAIAVPLMVGGSVGAGLGLAWAARGGDMTSWAPLTDGGAESRVPRRARQMLLKAPGGSARNMEAGQAAEAGGLKPGRTDRSGWPPQRGQGSGRAVDPEVDSSGRLRWRRHHPAPGCSCATAPAATSSEGSRR